jgi:hypothetical protein
VLDRLEIAAREAPDISTPGPTLSVTLEPAALPPAETPFADVWSEPASTSVSDAPPRADGAPVGEVGTIASVGAATAPQIMSFTLPGEETFTPWSVVRRGGRDVLDRLPSTARTVRSVIEQVVEAEGPIHLDRLAKLVAAAFDLSRVNTSRAAAITAQVPPSLLPDKSEPFAWPSSRRPSEWTAFRRASFDEPRVVEEVSNRELGNAMVAISEASFGIHREELLRETLALMGGRRLTPGIESRLATALKATIDAGRLKEQANGLLVAS